MRMRRKIGSTHINKGFTFTMPFVEQLTQEHHAHVVALDVGQHALQRELGRLRREQHGGAGYADLLPARARVISTEIHGARAAALRRIE